MKTGTKTTMVMKKSLYIITAILLSLVACTRNQGIDIQENGLSLIAKTESSSDSRTVVEGGTHVYWEPGDEITVFMGEKSAKFTTDITAASGTATFKGTFGEETWPEDLDLWAVYPFSEDATFDGETITTTLPSEQVARDGSFGKDMNLAIAHSSGTTLQFYNVGGGIRFSVLEEGVKRITFKGKQDEPIAGRVKIKPDDMGHPIISEIIQPASSITLTAPNGGCFIPDKFYFMVALPSVLSAGYELVGETDSGEVIVLKDCSTSVEMKRAVFGNLTNLSNILQNVSVTGEIQRINTDQPDTPAYDWKQGDRIVAIHRGKLYQFAADNDGYSVMFHPVDSQDPFMGADGDVVYAVSPALEIQDGIIAYDNYDAFDFVSKYDLRNERLPLPTMRGMGTIQDGVLHLSFHLIHSYLRIDLDKESRSRTIPNGNCVRIGGVTFTSEGTYDLLTQEIVASGGTSASFIYDYQDNPETLLQQEIYSFYYAVTPGQYTDLTICVENEYGSLFYGVSFDSKTLQSNELTVIKIDDGSATVSDGDFDNPPIVSW